MGVNAQTAVPAFTAGQVLTAQQQTQINTGIPVFATTTTRDAAFGGTGEKTLAQGQYAYIEATSTLQVYTGSAWITAASTIANASVTTGQATTSTSYTDLATAGPAVTVTTGTSALVLLTAGMRLNSAAAGQYMSFAVSGATTVAASDNYAVFHQSDAGTYGIWGGAFAYTITGLTAGSNTFTTKYRTTAGTANFYYRSITVWTL